MLRRAVVLSLCIPAVAASLAAQSVERSLAVAVERVEHLDASSNRLRLRGAFKQAGAAPVWLEIEDAGQLRFVADRGEVGRDEEASAGVWAAHIEHLTFPVEIVTPGRYRAWYRGLFPWGGTWLHTENMDGGEQQTVVDSKGETLNQWLWTPGPTYELTRGGHEWAFTPHAWQGGARLDKVALLPVGAPKPDGVGGEALRSTLPARGQAVTEPISPPKGALAWGAVRVDNVAGRGRVTVSVSSDDGGSWAPIGDDGRLEGVPVDRALRLMFVLERDEEGRGPIVAAPRVTCRVKPVPPIVLENARVRWTLSGEDGMILGIHNKATDTPCMAEGALAPLFGFRALRGKYGRLRDISFSQARLRGIERPGPDRAVFHYVMMGGGLTVDLDVRLDVLGLARFGMTVRNSTIYNIAEVIFPMLSGLRIGQDPSDDYLFTPVVTGSIVRYPAAFQFPRAAYSDRPLKHPGMASMCWMDLWDARGGGLYLACEDKQFRTTELTFSPGAPGGATESKADVAPLPPTQGARYKYAKQPGAYISLGFNKRILISRATGPVRLPDVVVGVHEGDWHWGADRYREWVSTWMRKLPSPDWWRDAEGWVDMHMVHLGDFVDLSKGWPKGSLKNLVRSIVGSLPLPSVSS